MLKSAAKVQHFLVCCITYPMENFHRAELPKALIMNALMFRNQPMGWKSGIKASWKSRKKSKTLRGNSPARRRVDDLP